MRHNRAKSVARRGAGLRDWRQSAIVARAQTPQKGRKYLGGKGNFAATGVDWRLSAKPQTTWQYRLHPLKRRC
jgi:hypothetical protein